VGGGASPGAHRSFGDVAYYAVASILVAFGVLGILSIGLPFLLIGVVLLALGPSRRRPERLWPPIVGVVVWTGTFVALVPTTCSVTGRARVGGPVTTVEACRNLLGFDPVGGQVTALLVASAAAIAVGISVRAFLVRRVRARAG
jgi:hypothetical protein